MAQTQRRLGRGLSSLISTPTPEVAATDGIEPAGPSAGQPSLRPLPIDALRPNPFQPRADVDAPSLDELVTSIKANGILQPVLVRRNAGHFEIIAGERRWRAAKTAGLAEIPATVRTASDEQMLEIALVENIIREDLNPLDRASAYRTCCDRFQMMPEELADRLGEDRTTVINYLRLLQLPNSVAELLRQGQLSMGHARSLLGFGDPDLMDRMAARTAKEGLSVRALEGLVRKHKEGKLDPNGRATASARVKRPHIRDLEKQFIEALATKVEINESRRKGRGRIIIHYHSLDAFDRIAEALGVREG